LYAASRLLRFYRRSREEDLFLRSGFRVADGSARGALNRIADDVLGGIEDVERLGACQGLKALTGPEPERVVARAFGMAAGSVLCHGAGAPEVSPEQKWKFLLGLGTGFGAGSTPVGVLARNSILTGVGIYLAYWHWRRYVEQQTLVTHPAVDRGLGVVIWLGSGVDPITAASIAHSFPVERQDDIWKGIGFALSLLSGLYAGQVRSLPAGRMLRSAGPRAKFLIDGLTFGTHQRQLMQSDKPAPQDQFLDWY
jgi:hypothetical protein